MPATNDFCSEIAQRELSKSSRHRPVPKPRSKSVSVDSRAFTKPKPNVAVAIPFAENSSSKSTAVISSSLLSTTSNLGARLSVSANDLSITSGPPPESMEQGPCGSTLTPQIDNGFVKTCELIVPPIPKPRNSLLLAEDVDDEESGIKHYSCVWNSLTAAPTNTSLSNVTQTNPSLLLLANNDPTKPSRAKIVPSISPKIKPKRPSGPPPAPPQIKNLKPTRPAPPVPVDNKAKTNQVSKSDCSFTGDTTGTSFKEAARSAWTSNAHDSNSGIYTEVDETYYNEPDVGMPQLCAKDSLLTSANRGESSACLTSLSASK